MYIILRKFAIFIIFHSVKSGCCDDKIGQDSYETFNRQVKKIVAESEFDQRNEKNQGGYIYLEEIRQQLGKVESAIVLEGEDSLVRFEENKPAEEEDIAIRPQLDGHDPLDTFYGELQHIMAERERLILEGTWDKEDFYLETEVDDTGSNEISTVGTGLAIEEGEDSLVRFEENKPAEEEDIAIRPQLDGHDPLDTFYGELQHIMAERERLILEGTWDKEDFYLKTEVDDTGSNEISTVGTGLAIEEGEDSLVSFEENKPAEEEDIAIRPQLDGHDPLDTFYGELQHIMAERERLILEGTWDKEDFYLETEVDDTGSNEISTVGTGLAIEEGEDSLVSFEENKPAEEEDIAIRPQLDVS